MLLLLATSVSLVLFRRTAAPPGPRDRLAVGGRPYFWTGANYPWKTGQDFGTGGWGHSGVSDPTTYQEIDADFANMAARGVRIVKWRVFGDGRYSPEFDADGYVTGLDDAFFPDVDAALELAARHDLYLVFTLFAKELWTFDCRSGGVHMGGGAATLLDPAKRRSLVERGVVPLLEHLRDSDRVLAFEIIAEPEWGVDELHREEDGRTKVPLAVVRDFVAQVTQAIHRDTRALATVEANRASNMHYWRGLGLDYYSYSWYDWLEPYEPLATPARALKLDRPIVLGEYPAGGSTYYQLPQILDLAYAGGYAGAFAWSFWGGDGFGPWRTAAPDFAAWVRPRWDAVDVGGLAPPPAEGPVTEQPYPYSYDGLEVRAEGGAVVVELAISVASGEPYVPRAYLYELGAPQPLQEVRLAPSKAQAGRLVARFDGVEEGKVYTVSLALFSRTEVLRKWFNNLSTFTLAGGQVTTPTLDPLATERPCSP
ncbi:MAG TPA: hypothetical protein VF310_14410 [Vicinamibacteria bacterium]